MAPGVRDWLPLPQSNYAWNSFIFILIITARLVKNEISPIRYKLAFENWDTFQIWYQYFTVPDYHIFSWFAIVACHDYGEWHSSRYFYYHEDPVYNTLLQNNTWQLIVTISPYHVYDNAVRVLCAQLNIWK